MLLNYHKINITCCRYPGVEPPGRPPNGPPSSHRRDYSGSRLGAGSRQDHYGGGGYNAPPPLVRGGGGMGPGGVGMGPSGGGVVTGMPGPPGAGPHHLPSQHRQEFKVYFLVI